MDQLVCILFVNCQINRNSNSFSLYLEGYAKITKKEKTKKITFPDILAE